MAERSSSETAAKQSRPEPASSLRQAEGKEDAKGKRPVVKKRTKTGCLSEYICCCAAPPPPILFRTTVPRPLTLSPSLPQAPHKVR